MSAHPPAQLPTTARGSDEPAHIPSRPDTIAQACPNPESHSGAPRGAVPPIGQVGRPTRRCVTFDRDARSTRRRPRVEAARFADQRPPPGSDRPSGSLAVMEQTRRASCSMICGWASPPIVPMTAASEPSSRVAAIGSSVWGGRRPGANSAGWPGSQVEPDASVVEVDAGVRLDQMAPESRGVGLDERHRHLAAVPGSDRRCTGRSCRRRRPGRTVRSPVRCRSRRSDRR